MDVEMMRSIGRMMRLGILLVAPISIPIAKMLSAKLAQKEEVEKYDYYLRISGVNVPYELFLSAMFIYMLLGIMLGAVLAKLSGNPIMMMVPIMIPLGMYMFVFFVFKSMWIKDIENNFADALRQMIEELRAGLSVFEVIKHVAESDYGALSEEFKIVVRDMDAGKTFEEAMIDMAERVESELVRRAVRLIIRISMSGGALADVLEAVENDIREIRKIELERKATTTMPCMVMALGGVICALPVGMAIAVIIFLGSKGAVTLRALIPQVVAASNTLILYPAVVGFSSGIGIGIVRYGEFKEGFKFAIPIAGAAAMVFYMMTHVAPALLMSQKGGLI